MSGHTKPIIQLVIGVHRSGTSVTTQVLSVLGYDLGRTLMLPAFDNPRGFWENSKVVEAHDRLFQALGVDWTTAATLTKNWHRTKAADKAVDELIGILTEDFDKSSNKLIKDPRLALLLPIWPKIAKKTGHDLHVLGALRRPSRIIASVAKRNDISKTNSELIVSSQTSVMGDVLDSYSPPVILFEKLTGLGATEIVKELKKALPHLKIRASKSLVDMIDRIVSERVSDGEEEDQDYDKILLQNKSKLFVDWSTARTYIDTVKFDKASFKNRKSLLPKSTKQFLVSKTRLDALKRAEEQKDKLLTDFENLETEIKDRKYELDVNRTKLERVTENLEKEKNKLKESARVIQQREEKIHSLFEEKQSLLSLRERLGQYEGEIGHLREEIHGKEALIAKAKDEIGLLQEEIQSNEKGAEAAKKQRDSLNLELRDLREAEGKLRLREKELLGNITAIEERLEQADEEKVRFEADLKRVNKNLKATKTRLGNKLKVKDELVAAKGVELDFLRDSISNLKENLIATRKRESDFETEVKEKSIALEDKSVALDRLGGELYETKAALKTTETNLTELTRIKEMQDTTIEMETLRSKMVEDEFTTKVSVLENRLGYYERAPLRTGLKSFLFSTLRLVRRGVPLPELFKLRLARKFTGLAMRLQPPAIHQSPEIDIFKPDDTIDFAFPEVENPVISIIVPVYNEISQTIACLKSIYQQRVSVPYEVILADDASPDPFHRVLKDIPGLIYVRQPENLHFLLNCNRAAEKARGDYLIFLNNDTLVKPGWMENLYATFHEQDNVGVAGSKLVYPSGELQEAGGIIWEDASGWNWGKGQNADHPIYNFVRDVDYISGASLMIPTALWKEIGGFNEGLEKAYYEDTDLCFQVREMGYRVVYQPSSVVVHIEGLTSGTDLSSGQKQYQLINQKIFKERWAHRLKHHLPNAQTPFLASDRAAKGHILYIDAVTPEPQKDSGSLDSFNAMRILTNLGYRVHFVPGSNFAFWGQATQDLQNMGVECVYHPFYSNLDMFIDDRGDMFDYAIVSRAECADLFIDKIRTRLPSAKIIYNTVDMHFLRMQRRAETTKDKDLAVAAKSMRVKELSYIEQSDATIILSSVEEEVLTDLGVNKDKLWLIPLIRPRSERIVEFESSQDMVFIGGYRHPPNVDAVDYMVEKIWPHIKKSLPGVKLRICGSSMPESFQDYASDSIVIQGFVPDLNRLLSKTRLTLAPLRFGAGLKGKVASSIGAGVPVIGTSIAFEGMAKEGLSDVILQADDPKKFAKLAVKAYKTEKLWTDVSHAGVAYHNANYAYDTISKTYEMMLNSVVDRTVLTKAVAV